MEALEGVILKADYLKKIKEIQPDKKHRTRNAELISRYLKFVEFENKNLENDLAVTFMLAQRYAKFHGYEKLESLLKWVEKKNNLKPQQVWKALTK